MITEKEMLNKIKWDERENPDDYSITYMNFKNEVEIPYRYIKNIDGRFMEILQDSFEFVEVPLHKIRKIKKNGIIVWSREVKKNGNV